MKAIVLAAGFATRLYPLTEHQAKPLLEIARRPMLSWILDRLLEIEPLDGIILVGNEKFAVDFEIWVAANKCRVPITFLNDGSTDDSNKLGAIGDISFALPEVPDGDEFLVIAGDNLFDFNLGDRYAEFKRQGKPMLLLREIADHGAKSRYNEVTIDDAGNVTGFREKPPDPKSNLVSICLYFFPPFVKPMVGEYLEAGGNPDAPGYFIEWLVKRTPVTATRLSGRWFDIGNKETLEAARKEFSGA